MQRRAYGRAYERHSTRVCSKFGVDGVRRRKLQQTHSLSCCPHSAAAAPARPRPMSAGPAWPPESRGFERFELAGERALTSPRTAAAPRACRCQLRRAAASCFPGRNMQALLHSIETVLVAASGAKESIRTCVLEPRYSCVFEMWALIAHRASPFKNRKTFLESSYF